MFLDLIRAKLAPTTFKNPVHYDGWEWKWKFFVFRPQLLAKELRNFEPYALAFVVFYFLLFLCGRWYNFRMADSWLKAHLPLLSAQFSRPTTEGLSSDGCTDFFNFSTGRRAIISLHSVLSLRPRHDIFRYIFDLLWTFTYDLEYTPLDKLELDFTLSDDVNLPEFVFSIVRKDQMKRMRKERWDLAFTATKENPALPPSVTVMSEFADVTDSILKLPATQSLLRFCTSPYFLSFSITDQPYEKPLTPADFSPDRGIKKRVTLALSVPPPSRASDTLPMVTAIFDLIDTLGRISLRTETKAKIKKAREDFGKLVKQEAEKEKKEEAEDAKREKKKREEEERISKLTAAEQQKILDRDRKRANKKFQGKIVRR